MATTVRENHGLACPNCGEDSHLEVAAVVWVRLTPNGTDDADDGSQEWDADSAIQCGACQHEGHVSTFRCEGV